MLDLDGVVWRGDREIAGASGAIRRLQHAGVRVVYATNNASLTSAGYVAKLANFGITADERDVIHGGHAAAQVVEPGERVLLAAGVGVAEALAVQDHDVVDVADVRGSGNFDVAMVGIRPGYQVAWLSLAVRAVLGGARLVAPSGDPIHPVADGFDIGGGSLAHAVGHACGVKPVVAGKPNQPIADVVRSRVGIPAVVVGDQARTDGRLAEMLGVPFALVATGVTAPGGRTASDSQDVPLAVTAHDLATVVDRALAK